MNLNVLPVEKPLLAKKLCKSIRIIVKPLRIYFTRPERRKGALMNENLNLNISGDEALASSERRCISCGFVLFKNIFRNGSFIIDPASLKANLMMTIDHRHFCICPECQTRNNVDIKKEGRLLGCIEDFEID
jgi:hypothetical protein